MNKSRSTSAVLAALALLAAGTMASEARAANYSFDIIGPGVSGSFTLTYGAATDSKYPDAFEVTGISGTFSDSNNGLNIVDAPIGALVPITHDAPDATNLLAPHDFSRFPVAAGTQDGSLSFDNLLWPNGSPQTATDYPPHGGFLDIYGLLFNIGGGQVVDFWSNGPDYGVAVATPSTTLDYTGGVAAVPEPGSYVMLAGGLLALLAFRRTRKS
jgi:hypothetical protein